MTNGALAAISGGVAAALDLVFPPRCVLCDSFGEHYLCAECASKMPRPVPEPICPRCGHNCKSLPCSDCLGDPPYFVAALAAGEYTGELQEAVHWLKYRDRPMLAEPLGLILAAFAKQKSGQLAGLAFDAIVPIPLHPARERLRGYNQTERLARVLGRELRLPVRADLLRRVRATHPQVGLDGDARRSNLDSAFRAEPERVQGLSVLVIDDVSTTGTTFRAAAKTLKQAGAKAIFCLALAAD